MNLGQVFVENTLNTGHTPVTFQAIQFPLLNRVNFHTNCETIKSCKSTNFVIFWHTFKCKWPLEAWLYAVLFIEFTFSSQIRHTEIIGQLYSSWLLNCHYQEKQLPMSLNSNLSRCILVEIYYIFSKNR